MATRTLVFCWEMGGGNGHIGPFERLARRFIQDGWRVVLIVKDLSRVATFFEHGEVEVIQAPVKLQRAVPWIRHPGTFGHILPDAAIFDHCPTGLLASRGMPFRRFTIGHGFYIPVDEQPLATVAPWRRMSPEQRLSDERVITDRVNTILTGFEQPELPRLGALFSDVDRNLFTTYRELDHNPHRQDAEYFGTWGLSERTNVVSPPAWPTGTGPKVYAYLKPMDGLRELIALLTHRGVPTIAVFDHAQTHELQPLAGPNICLVDRPIKLSRLSGECDLAITNAGHGTICELLKAGIPQMLIPLTLEQSVLAKRVVGINAAVEASATKKRLVLNHLNGLLSNPAQLDGAVAFSQKNSASDESNVTAVYHAISLRD